MEDNTHTVYILGFIRDVTVLERVSQTKTRLRHVANGSLWSQTTGSGFRACQVQPVDAAKEISDICRRAAILVAKGTSFDVVVTPDRGTVRDKS